MDSSLSATNVEGLRVTQYCSVLLCCCLNHRSVLNSHHWLPNKFLVTCAGVFLWHELRWSVWKFCFLRTCGFWAHLRPSFPHSGVAATLLRLVSHTNSNENESLLIDIGLQDKKGGCHMRLYPLHALDDAAWNWFVITKMVNFKATCSVGNDKALLFWASEYLFALFYTILLLAFNISIMTAVSFPLLNRSTLLGSKSCCIKQSTFDVSINVPCVTWCRQMWPWSRDTLLSCICSTSHL